MAELPDRRRRSRRQYVQLPAVLRGMDERGRAFFERTEIILVDQHGARVRTRFLLRVGDEVGLELTYGHEVKRLRVIWRGAEGTPEAGLVGTEFVDLSFSWSGALLNPR